MVLTKKVKETLSPLSAVEKFSLLERVFSVKNMGIHKVVTIFGIKIKFKSKKLIEQKRWADLNNKLDQQTQRYNEVVAELNNKLDQQSQKCNEIINKIKIERTISKFYRDKTDNIKNCSEDICLQENINYTTPSFSIIMPTYNRVFCITNAVDSLLSQTYQEFELLIIDDGSTDNIQKILAEKYHNELLNNKIRYFKADRNFGVCTARNVGLKHAKNQWIGYLDTDNVLKNDFLETFVNAIQQEKKLSYYAKIRHNTGNIIGKDFDYVDLCKANYIDLGVFVHHKSLTYKYGYFDTNLKRLVDWELIIRYTKDKSVHFIDKVLLEYDNSDNYERITNTESWSDARNYIREKIEYSKLYADNSSLYKEEIYE